jgi:hypothetical protein
MPLPFAPKPEESKVYESLKSVILEDVTADQLDTLRNTVFAQGIDGAEDEYRRLLLVMLAGQSGSVSGPIPATGKIEQFSGSYSSGDYEDVFTPGAGECWEVVSADFNATLSSGTVDSVQLYVDIGGTAVMVAENLGDNFDSFKDYFSSPILVDENMTIQVRASDANITALACRVLLIRVR